MSMKSVAKLATALAGQTYYVEHSYGAHSMSGTSWVDLVEYDVPDSTIIELKTITGSMSAGWTGSPLYRIVDADGVQVWPYDSNGASLPTTEHSFEETIRLNDDFKIQCKSTASDETLSASIISFKVKKMVW